MSIRVIDSRQLFPVDARPPTVPPKKGAFSRSPLPGMSELPPSQKAPSQLVLVWCHLLLSKAITIMISIVSGSPRPSDTRSCRSIPRMCLSTFPKSLKE